MEQEQSKAVRFFYLDNIKTFLIILLILVHTAMTFGNIDGWYYYEPHNHLLTTNILIFFVAVNQAFLLALFFALSGFLTPASADRKGNARFITDRIKRLGLPFLAYLLIITPVFAYLQQVNYMNLSIPFSQFYFRMYRDFLFNGVGPMWFVLVLLIFTIGYTLLTPLFQSKRSGKETEMSPSKKFPSILILFVVIILLALLNFLVRLQFPINGWIDFRGVFLIDMSHIGQYIFFFVAGIMAFRNKWLSNLSDKTGRFWAWMLVPSLLGWPVMMLAGGIINNGVYPFLGGMSWQALVYCFWEILCCMSACIGILWFFKKRINHSNLFIKQVNTVSFSVYCIHMPLVIGLGYLLSGLSVHPFVKFAGEGLISIILCFSLAVIVKKFIAKGDKPLEFNKNASVRQQKAS